MMFDDLTTGPSNDLQVATALAHDMVTKYGMSSTLGPIAFEASGGILMGRGGMIEREYSQDVAMRIDKEVELIMNTQLERARALIERHKPVLDAIAVELMTNETIEREAFEKLLTLHGIKPKRKMGEEVYIAPAAKIAERIREEDAKSDADAKVIVTHDAVVSDSSDPSSHKGNRKKEKQHDKKEEEK